MMMPQLALLMVVGAINSLCTPQSDDVSLIATLNILN